MRVSSPPVGTIPSASDVTDSLNRNSKPQGGSGVTVAPLPPALLLLVLDAAARTTGRDRFVTLLRVPRAPLAASMRGGGGS